MIHDMSMSRTAGTNSPQKKLLSVREFAVIYGVGQTNVYALLKKGRLKAVKIGNLTRIRAEEAERWAENLPARAA